MVTERVLYRAIDSRGVRFWVIGAKGNVLWKARLRYSHIHLDQHVIGATDILVTQIFKQSLWFFRLTSRTHARSKTQFCWHARELTQGALLRPVHQPCADAQSFVLRIDTAPHPGVDKRFGRD